MDQDKTMWNEIWLDLDSTFCGKSMEELEQWLRKLQQERRFEIREVHRDLDEIESEQKESLSDKVILITGNNAAAEAAGQYGIPVIGCEAEQGESLWDADIVFFQIEDITLDQLDRVYQRKHGLPWTIAVTDRCVIREMTMEDLDALFELYQCESIHRFMEPLYEREKEAEYTRAYIENMYSYFGYGMWLVFDRESGALIGRAGINNLEWEDEVILELGYAIADPFQHRGIATEVCHAILSYMREQDFGFQKLYCFIEEENKVSINFAEKLGFLGKVQVLRDGVSMVKYEIEV